MLIQRNFRITVVTQCKTKQKEKERKRENFGDIDFRILTRVLFNIKRIIQTKQRLSQSFFIICLFERRTEGAGGFDYRRESIISVQLRTGE